MTFPRFSFLKPKAVFPETAPPDMTLSDLAREPVNSPYARACVQRAYQNWEAAYQAAVFNDKLGPDELLKAIGAVRAMHRFIVDLEQAHATARKAVENK